MLSRVILKKNLNHGYSYIFITHPQNQNESNSLALFFLFDNVLSSIHTSFTWLPLRIFCCPPSLHSSLAENRELLLGQE